MERVILEKKKILVLCGSVILTIVFLICVFLNVPTFKGKTVNFKSSYKEKSVTLQGTYWQGRGAEYAVLVCPGYSCDRQKWRPVADLLVSNSYSTMVFDYSGQGASSGTIGFDNAKTDCIPVQISDAIEKLHELSGIDYDHIILVGHSMGGRSILRLLYDYNYEGAETTVKKRDLAAAILFSPEVNYHFNAQASLFAGTSDADESPWNIYNEDCAGGLHIYLYGSTADDIVSDEDVMAISERLGNHATMGITNGVLHSYEMYSIRFAKFMNQALEEISGKKSTYGAWKMSLIYVVWFGGLLGLLLLLAGLNVDLKWKTDEQIPQLLNPKRYLFYKLFMWIPGILIAFVLYCLCVVMPFGSPIMNTPYMCFISGYGITMLFAYRKGRFKGTEGKLARVNFKLSGKGNQTNLLKTVAITFGLCFFVWYVLRTTMYRLIPFNFRLFWVLFATVLMSVGYYVSGCESDMFEKSRATAKVRFLYNLIQYVPLFLLVGFYWILKSYSGMIGQIQNMLLMYIFCIPLGDFIKKKTGNRIIGAVVTAFLFQTLMITSAALIAI